MVKLLSRVRLFATPWTVDCQAPLTIGFSRQGYWSGLSCPPARDLPNPGIKSGFWSLLFHLLHWQVGSTSLAPPGKPYDSIQVPTTWVQGSPS